MKKNYIAPEAEIIITELSLLQDTLSKTKGQGAGDGHDGDYGGTGGESGGTGGGGLNDARQHNNWMWDTMEDEY